MNEINQVKSAFPDVTPNQSVRESAFTAAGSIRQIHLHRTRRRRLMAGTALTLALGVGGVIAGPKAYAYYRIEQISNSITDCKSAFMETYMLKPDGSADRLMVTYYSDGKWRMERDGITQIYASPNLWIYEPSSRTVKKMYKPEGPFAYNPSGFSVKAMVADMNQWHWTSTNLSVGTEKDNGRDVDVVTVTQSPFGTREKTYADPKTHMPYRMTMENFDGGRWVLREYSTFQFDRSLPPKLFSTNFPDGTKVIDSDVQRAQWRANLEHPIATLKSKTGTVEIREIYANQRGHLFVLFTDGTTTNEMKAYIASMRAQKPLNRYPILPSISVEDSTGMTYLKSEQFQVYINPINHQPERHIVFNDGQILQGIWLVPSQVQPWKSKDVTISFTFYWSHETTNPWKVRVQPQKSLLPAWYDVCAIGPRSDADIVKAETDTRNTSTIMRAAPSGPSRANTRR